MKKMIYLIFAHICLLGCVSSPMQGAFVTLDTNHHVYGYSNGSFINSSKIVKYGRSCSYSSIVYLWLFYSGNGGSIEKAMKEGDIKKVAVIDRESFSIFGPVFAKECVIVWGE